MSHRKSSMMGSGKYEFEPYKLNLDVQTTIDNTKRYKLELMNMIDDIYFKNLDKFRLRETAIEILLETLREKFIEYNKKL